jgi:gliding motility-associated-like protein
MRRSSIALLLCFAAVVGSDKLFAQSKLVSIPEELSPNGDGKKDTWIIDGVTRYDNNELKIYNRWGSLVFEANPYMNDWDGESLEGKPLAAGAYVYILYLNDTPDTVYQGTITLIR